MSATEKGELRLNDAFSPFSGLDPLLYNPFTDPLWKSAIEQFERAIQPTEDKVSGKLRQKLRELDLASYQVVIVLHQNVLGFFGNDSIFLRLLNFCSSLVICLCQADSWHQILQSF